jgi:hypothetical protein
MLLKCFLNYTGAQYNKGNPIEDDWDQITQADYDSFCIDRKYIIPIADTRVTNGYSIKTDKVLKADTFKAVHRSLLRPAAPDDLKVRAESLGGENNNVIKSQYDIDNNLPYPKHLITLTPPPIVDPNNFIGLIFLMDA